MKESTLQQLIGTTECLHLGILDPWPIRIENHRPQHLNSSYMTHYATTIVHCNCGALLGSFTTSWFNDNMHTEGEYADLRGRNQEGYSSFLTLVYKHILRGDHEKTIAEKP